VVQSERRLRVFYEINAELEQLEPPDARGRLGKGADDAATSGGR